MRPAGDRSAAREIARGLLEVLEPALAAEAPSLSLTVARDVAQLLSLRGLERLIVQCQRLSGRTRPAELELVLERVRRIVARCESEGSIAPFAEADRELAALAAQLEGLSFSVAGQPAPPVVPVATLSALEALGDAPLAPATARAQAARVMLRAKVASALRAALDWLAPEPAARRPLGVLVEDSVLELALERVNLAGVMAASDVLASVDGNLGPAPGPRGAQGWGAWVLRIPTVAERSSFLMLEQGHLKLALPWHAVLRLRMASDEIAAKAEGAALEPLTRVVRGAVERPRVLLAHGLRRGWLTADRLVWRLPASACDPGSPPPSSGLTRAVRTEDGETYWVAEPAWLLRAVEPLRLPPRPPRGQSSPDFSAPEKKPRVETARLSPAERATGATLDLLSAAEVEPLPADRLAVRSRVTPPGQRPTVPHLTRTPPNAEPSAPAGTHAKPPAPQPLRAATSAAAGRRALVAEDSITARIFLMRLLEMEGFEVEGVNTAAELFEALRTPQWSLVCADVELPDARGTAFVRDLAALRSEAARFTLVALVRDAEDLAAASAAGVSVALRKPFEREALQRLLTRLHLSRRTPDEHQS